MYYMTTIYHDGSPVALTDYKSPPVFIDKDVVPLKSFRVFNGEAAALYVNRFAGARGEPINKRATDIWQIATGRDSNLSGTVFLVQADTAEEMEALYNAEAY